MTRAFPLPTFLHALHVTGRMGKGDGAAIPRLAGQLYGYTLKTLDNWNRERAPGSGDPGNVMRTVTQNMSRSQNAAVAAYLSYQK